MIFTFFTIFAIFFQVADVLITGYLLLAIAFLYSYEHNGVFKELSMVHFLALVVVALLVDLGFLITLIIGVFKVGNIL